MRQKFFDSPGNLFLLYLIIFLSVICIGLFNLANCKSAHSIKQNIDYARCIITSSGVRSNFFGSTSWTIAKVIESNRADIKMVTTNYLLGSIGDTVVCYRIPKTNQWNFTGHH